MESITNLIFLLTVCILLFIAWQDFQRRIITHCSLLLLSVMLAAQLIISRQWPNMGAALVVLVIGFLLFAINVIGGGDVKLMALLSLTMSSQQLYCMLFFTAVIGGIIGVFALLFFRHKSRSAGIPYGIAISLSAILTHTTVYSLP